jgi:hypothetical protein
MFRVDYNQASIARQIVRITDGIEAHSLLFSMESLARNTQLPVADRLGEGILKYK